MMKMDTDNKSNKARHFQTTEKKKINGQNTKGENIEGLSYKQRQKKSCKCGANNVKKCHACDSSDSFYKDMHKPKKYICHI